MNGVKCLKFFCATALFISITAASANFEALAGELKLPAYDSVNEPYMRDHWIDATGNFHEAAQKLVEEFGTPQDNIPRSPKATEPKTEGMREEFNVMNIESNAPEKRAAILKKIGRHCYLYLEEGKEFSGETLQNITDRFDDVIYKAATETFGSEPRPGIDNDERITLLMVDIKDGWKPGKGFVGGYFFPFDCYPANTVNYSNEREMIYLDCYPAKPDDPFYPGVIAHEFQHMIHFACDPREDKWLNEGCSQLAFHACGYDHPAQIASFMANPGEDTTVWQNSIEDYGAVYLMHYYIFQKYAGATLDEKRKFYRSLVASPLKGIESVDAALKEFNAGKTFEDIYRDWLIANLINRPDLNGGLYGYDRSLTMRVHATHNITALPAKIEKAQLLNHGAANIVFTPFTPHLPETPACIEKFVVYSQKPAVISWGINGWNMPPGKYLPPKTSWILSANKTETRMTDTDENGLYKVEFGPFTGAGDVDTFNYILKYDDGTCSQERTIDIIGPAGRAAAAEKRMTEKSVLVVKFKGAKPTDADKNKEFRLIEIIEDANGKITAGDVPLKDNQAKIAVPSYGKSIAKVYFIAYQINNKKLAFSLDAELVSSEKEAGKAYIMKVE